MSGNTIGDMGGGQIGQRPVVDADIEWAVGEGDDLGQHIAVGEFDTFGRPRGAGGVDEGGEIAGFYGLPGGVEIEVGIGVGLEVREGDRAVDRPVDDDEMFDRHACGADGIEELLFGDDDGVAGITEDMRDLFGRAGVVDGERSGAHMQGRRIEKIELRPVGEHDAHRVAAGQAERGQTGGEHPNSLSVLPPGDFLGAADGTQGDRVGAEGEGLLKGRGQRADGGAGAVGVGDICGHGPFPRCWGSGTLAVVGGGGEGIPPTESDAGHPW